MREMFTYLVYDLRKGTCTTCRSLKEVSGIVHRNPSTVLTRILDNLIIDGFRIQRFCKGDSIPKIGGAVCGGAYGNKNLAEYGIVGFDSEGVRHWYENVENASAETGVPRLHVRECLVEGCGYEGWTFDYALEKEEVDAR